MFLGGVLAEGQVDDIGIRFDSAMHNGEVSLVDLSFLELSSQPPMGGVAFCRHHDTGGVSVQSVNDSRPGEFFSDG